MTTLAERLHNLHQEFHDLEQWSLRYQHLIELGKKLPPLAASQKNDANLVKGCLSKVWLGADVRNGCLFFWGDSDAVMPKGLVALVVEIFSGENPSVVASFKEDVLAKFGLRQNLTPTRAAAMENMMRRVQEIALAAEQGTQT